MTILILTLKSSKKDRYVLLKRDVNSDNYKELALLLSELEFQGLPIKKAVKEYNMKNSDWNIALGMN